MKYDLGLYPSKEMKIYISHDLKGKIVFLVGSILPDANSLLELLVAADGFKLKGAKVKVIIPYLAYARQDKPEKREPFAAKIVCRMLKTASFEKAYIIDVHSNKLKRFFRFENVIPSSIFKEELFKISNPIIIAPDKGGIERAKSTAGIFGRDIAYIEKKRLGPGKAKILNLKGEVKARNAVIIDDIIDTGSTIISAAKLLKENGAKDIYVAATHGLFSRGAVEQLEKSPIKKIIITNTLPVKPNSKKIKVAKIEPLIETILKGGNQ